MLLDSVLPQFIRIGRLTLIDAAGRRHVFEGGPGPAATVRLHDPALHWKLAGQPAALRARSLYGRDADGRGRQPLRLHRPARPRTTPRLTRACRCGWQRRASASCAGFTNTTRCRGRGATRRIITICRTSSTSCFSTATGNIPAPISARRTTTSTPRSRTRSATSRRSCCCGPGTRCSISARGWGGLALYLAGECGADVTGLTLSEEQLKVAKRRAAAAGLADRVRFYLRDYREESGRYDRIVSVGMFEHVGVNQYPAFFGKLSALLAPDGVALLHSIGRMDGPGATNPWLRKYIFPGGYVAGPVRGRAARRAGAAVDHRYRDPAAALRRDAARLARAGSSAIATASARSTTSASAACGRCIWSAPRWPSAAAAIWCSRCSSRSRSMRCR